MHQSENEKITARFFEALYALKAKGVIRGKKTFTDRYNINRWNLNALEAKNPNTTQNSAQLPWLVYLVRDYGVAFEHFMIESRCDCNYLSGFNIAHAAIIGFG